MGAFEVCAVVFVVIDQALAMAILIPTCEVCVGQNQNQGNDYVFDVYLPTGAIIMMPCVYPAAIKCFISCGSPKKPRVYYCQTSTKP